MMNLLPVKKSFIGKEMCSTSAQVLSRELTVVAVWGELIKCPPEEEHTVCYLEG